ncbi:unnamed protein product, partial [Clonostachys rosea]
MQFMSQSMGWADNLILAMGPLGIITIIVSAIRVGGPKWLKALVGRARENLAAAEMELLSSTSEEVCELWNGSEVVRCMGKCPLTEFIILIPQEGVKDNSNVVIEEDWTKYLKKADEENGQVENVYPEPVNHTPPDDKDSGTHSRGTEEEHSSDESSSDESSSDESSSDESSSDDSSSDENSSDKNSSDEHRSHEHASDQSTHGESSHEADNDIIVIRISDESVKNVPNMSLNCHKLSTPLELWIIAIIGTILQLGVVVYWAFATYYPALQYPKDDKKVADYAYPCAAAGTFTLVVGMVLCSHVVESRTKEQRYIPRHGAHDVYFCWLQQEKTVNDQSFNSHIIYCKKKNKYIVTSRRDGEGSGMQMLTVSSTLFALCGFVVQFVGLRGLHWSASVTQLGIVLFMLVCKAFVRRGLASPPESSGSLQPGFELEWLTKNTEPEDRVIDSEEELSAHSMHGMMTVRRDFGRLADWRERPSKEAIAITKSIEIAMNILFSKTKYDEKSIPWSIKNLKAQEIKFQVQHRNGRFTVNYLEMDAVLSLWLFADNQQHSEVESNPSQDPDSENRRNGGKADSWLRSKGLLPESALCILGPYSRDLHRDIWWWMPTKEKPLFLVHKKETRNKEYVSIENLGERYGRVVGSEYEYDWFEKPGTRLKISLLDEPEFDKQSKAHQRFLATEKKTSMELVYAQHLFSVFMMAAAANNSAHIDPSKTIIRTEPTNNGDGWRSFTVVNETLSKMAIEIQQTGLGSLEEIYQCILPPLSLWNKLPQPNEMIEIARKEARVYEKAGQWEEAGEIYLALLRRTRTYPQNSAIAIKATATVFQFWRQVVFAIETEMAGDVDLKVHGEELKSQLRDMNEGLFFELRSLYIVQAHGRAWEDNLGKTKLVEMGSFRNEFGITVSHEAAWSGQWWRVKPQHMRSADVFGWIPLHYAAAQGSHRDRITTVEEASKSADINARDLIEWTPLHYACCEGEIRVVQTIIQLSADINAPGRDNFTPLHCAAYHGYEEIVATLIEAGADVNFQDVFGNSPLFWAIRKSHEPTFGK